MIQTKWFDDLGVFVGELPQECILQCSAPGPCDAAVTKWREALEFSVPREKAIAYIRETGGWPAEELVLMKDKTLADIVLWIACGDMREFGEWIGLVI